MDLQGQLTVDYGDHGLHLGIIAGVLTGSLGIPVVDSLLQFLTEHSRNAHTGHGRLLIDFTVALLGVSAQSTLHSGRILYHHIVHTLAVELNGAGIAAQNVGTAGGDATAGNTAHKGIFQTLFCGVDAVQSLNVGGDGVQDLVIVIFAGGDALQTGVAVSIHAAGSHQTTFSINNRSADGCGDVLTDGSDLSVVIYQHTAVFNFLSGDGFDMTVFDQQHNYSPYGRDFNYL